MASREDRSFLVDNHYLPSPRKYLKYLTMIIISRSKSGLSIGFSLILVAFNTNWFNNQACVESYICMYIELFCETTFHIPKGGRLWQVQLVWEKYLPSASVIASQRSLRSSSSNEACCLCICRHNNEVFRRQDASCTSPSIPETNSQLNKISTRFHHDSDLSRGIALIQLKDTWPNRQVRFVG